MEIYYQQQNSSYLQQTLSKDTKGQLHSSRGEIYFETALIIAFIILIMTSVISTNNRLFKIEVDNLQQFKSKWIKLENKYGKNRQKY